jgi:PQQ-like domain
VGSEIDGAGDEIWRPDYDGPPPLSMPIRLAATSRSEGADRRRPAVRVSPRSEPGADTASVPPSFEPAPVIRSRSDRRLSPRTVGAVVAVVAVSAVGALTATRSGDTPDDPAAVPAVSSNEFAGGQRTERDELPDVAAISGVPFAGADPKRLPETLDPIWSMSFGAAESDDVWVEVVDRQRALVATGGGGTSTTGSSTLRLLDAETGVTRWSSDVAVPLRSVTFVAANSESIALVVDRTLTGIDSASGAAVWAFELDPAVVGNDVERLAGTDLLAVDSPDGTSTLVAMASGETVGRLAGPRIGTDHVGDWYVRRGRDIVRYELADGFQEPSLVVSAVEDPVVAMIGPDVLTSGPQGWKASFESDGSVRRAPEPVANADDLPAATVVVAMLGSTFVVAASGSIVGAELDGRELRSAWTREGAMIATYPTERGFLVHAATEGGAVQTIYDGRTGEVVDTLAMTAGVFDRLVVTGNGILTKKVAFDGTRLAGLDLDGIEMWSIKDVAAAAVGDHLIVTTTRLDDGSIVLDALGRPPTSS